MEVKIVKIDGEFVIVEIKNGEWKVCPKVIFPREIKERSKVALTLKEEQE